MNQYTTVCSKGGGGINDNHLPDVTMTLTSQIMQKSYSIYVLLKLHCHVQEYSS